MTDPGALSGADPALLRLPAANAAAGARGIVLRRVGQDRQLLCNCMMRLLFGLGFLSHTEDIPNEQELAHETRTSRNPLHEDRLSGRSDGATKEQRGSTRARRRSLPCQGLHAGAGCRPNPRLHPGTAIETMRIGQLAHGPLAATQQLERGLAHGRSRFTTTGN